MNTGISAERMEDKAEPVLKTARMFADELQAGGMRCNCDLDNWEPTVETRHSDVCRIHAAALALFNKVQGLKT